MKLPFKECEKCGNESFKTTRGMDGLELYCDRCHRHPSVPSPDNVIREALEFVNHWDEHGERTNDGGLILHSEDYIHIKQILEKWDQGRE